jgi:hypothetical protein
MTTQVVAAASALVDIGHLLESVDKPEKRGLKAP